MVEGVEYFIKIFQVRFLWKVTFKPTLGEKEIGNSEILERHK